MSGAGSSAAGSRDKGLLCEVELKKQSAELERLNSELEALTYCVSHDLRGPLNMLGQFAGMIIKRYDAELEPEVGRGIRTIKNTADQIDRMLEGLLQLSRAGRARLSPERLDMRELFQEVWRDLDGFRKAPVRFEIGELPSASGDRNLIRQVVYNLLANAAVFSSRRRIPRIEVSGRIEGGFSFFQVKDNGAGFRNKESPQLFGIFKRLHGSELEGTGVGLAIVRKIIQRHGGEVSAEGRRNRGATFHFSLPRER